MSQIAEIYPGDHSSRRREAAIQLRMAVEAWRDWMDGVAPDDDSDGNSEQAAEGTDQPDAG